MVHLLHEQQVHIARDSLALLGQLVRLDVERGAQVGLS